MDSQRHQLKSALCRVLLLFPLLLTGAGQGHSQEPTTRPVERDVRQKAVVYAFVSPNTLENLTLVDALKLLNSPEELRLVKDIRFLSACLGVRPMIRKSIGSWTDGAEHSALFRVYADQDTIIYEAARLGKIQRQKSVLYFKQAEPGAGRMYILSLRRRKPFSSISRKLDESGVIFRTLVPVRERPTIIYVVDLENKLRKQVISAARNLGARLAMIKGNGAFIGDNSDRAKAQAVFDEAISKYEAGNPAIARKCAMKN